MNSKQVYTQSKFSVIRFFFIALLAAFMLVGCGGGGQPDGGSGGSNQTKGDVIIGLTDAAGDFATYTVDVLSLTLTRQDGAIVETLPLKARVDFAQYVEVTEFLTAASVPIGTYTHATLTLDYRNADIQYDNGTSLVTVSPRDKDGNILTTLEINVELPNVNRIVVWPGIPAHVTLDFDLKASNTVDAVAETVTVSPLLLAEVNPKDPKIHRVRGPLQDVNLDNNSFRVIIRPFGLLNGDFGRLTVLTDNNTEFEINGQTFMGNDGLLELNTFPFATAIVVRGDLITGTRQFMATEVYAGSSVAFGDKDVVYGSVVARNGDVITVRGASLIRADGTLIFRDNVNVTIGDNTILTRQLSGGIIPNKDDISVGQQVTVLGTLGADINSPTMDATEGLLRMCLSSLAATVNSINGNQLNVNIQYINGRHINLYNFSGTGGANPDSNPVAYRVHTGSLDLSGLNNGSAVRVRGFAVPFGQAVSDDFTAQTVINLDNVPSTLLTNWFPASVNPFTTTTDTALVLNMNGTGVLHHIFQYGIVTDLKTLGSPTTLTENGRGLYAVFQNGRVVLYTEFGKFVAALNNKLGTLESMDFIASRGRWDLPSTTLTTNVIAVHFQ